jgi:hypothetical protein
MNRLQLSISCILFTIIPFSNSFSQTAVVAAGGDAVGPTGTVAYSVGQLDYDHYTGPTGSINLGVQQPDFVIIISTHEIADRIEIKLFPNPVGDEAHLLFEEESYQKLDQNIRYEMYDLSGKMVMRGQINESKTIVHTGNLPNGEYLLRVMSKDQDLKTFKIVKSN